MSRDAPAPESCGRSLGYDDTGGDGVALVLVHGFPLDRTIWAAQASGLAGAARVITPDLCGFGESAGTPARDPGAAPSMAHYAADVADLLDALGIGPAVVGGVSMGGYVAMAYHRDFAHRVRGLVLADTRRDPDSAEALAHAEGSVAIAAQMIAKMPTPATAEANPDPWSGLSRLMASQPVEGVVRPVGLLQRARAEHEREERQCGAGDGRRAGSRHHRRSSWRSGRTPGAGTRTGPRERPCRTRRVVARPRRQGVGASAPIAAVTPASRVGTLLGTGPPSRWGSSRPVAPGGLGSGRRSSAPRRGWTWTAIDADSKLCVSWLVGERDTECATIFMKDVASRIANRVRLTTDGHRPYLVAVEDAFGGEIDYAMLSKKYGAPGVIETHRDGDDALFAPGSPHLDHLAQSGSYMDLHGSASSWIPYALVRRGCRLIIISDAGHDPHIDDWGSGDPAKRALAFEDFRRLEERVFADFGARLHVRWASYDPAGRRGGDPDRSDPKEPRTAPGDGRVLVATCDNLPVDGLDGPVVFLIVKCAQPRLLGLRAERSLIDLQKATDGQFGNDPTTDQFFSESRVIAYRELAHEIVLANGELLRGAFDRLGARPARVISPRTDGSPAAE